MKPYYDKNQIVSFSGGKDSTAMLLMMLERDEPIHSVVFCDTGWEFPEMLEHIDKVEDYVGMKFVRVKPKVGFDYLMLEREIKSGKHAGLKGYGWPSVMRRWCTREKVSTINRFCKTVSNPLSCIGMAYDEHSRLYSKFSQKYSIRYPLVDYHVTEQEALEYCYEKGFYWNGLYSKFRRVSCFCCPLQRLGELRKLRRYCPDLWAKMLEWDNKMPAHNTTAFKDGVTVHDLEKRFEYEDRQEVLPL